MMAGQLTLNWGKGRTCKGHFHWGRPAACRRCGGQTPLRDCDNRPCHKVCAELELNAATDRAVAAATRHQPTTQQSTEEISG